MSSRVPAALAALALATGACSAIGIRTPPSSARPPLTCTRDSAAIALDTVMAIGLGATGGWFLIDEATTNYGEWDEVGYVVALPMLAVATLYGLSAWHGVRATEKCDALHAKFAPPAPAPPP